MTARITAWLVLLVAAAAPWAFGATDPAWAAALAIGCLVPGAVALVASGPLVTGRANAVALAAVALAALVGLLPVPHALRAFLLPGGTHLLDAVGAGGGLRTLSLAPRATARAAALAAAYVLAFLALEREARKPSGRRVVTVTLALTGVLLAALGIAQHVSQSEDLQPRIYWTIQVYEAGTPFGPYVNRNHFAGAMSVLACVAAGEALAAWSEQRVRVGAAYALAGGTMLAALAVTTSRGGALGACAGLVFLVACAPAGRRFRGVLLTAGALAAVAAVLAWTGLLDRFLNRFVTLSGRWQNRFRVQADAWNVFLGNPATGTGAGTFESVYPAFQTVCDDRIFEDAHSDWAQILMETGLVGVAAAVLAVRRVVVWVRAGQAAVGPVRWRVLGPAAGVVAVAAHGVFEVNLHVPANALLTVCALSLASAAAVGQDVPPHSRECASAAASAA